MTTSDKHSLRSSEREEYVEYVFLAAICSYGWSIDRFVEVARAQTDAFGYDLILNSGGVTRHVQLKASVIGGSAVSQKVGLSLSEKASGCVVWIKIHPDTLAPVLYGWFGGDPNEKLPDLGDKIAKHTKANAQGAKNARSSQRVIPWNRFVQKQTTELIFDALFGEK